MGDKPDTPLPSKPAGTRWLWLVVVLVGIAFLYFIISPTMFFLRMGRWAAYQAAAVGSLRTINTAEIAYAETYKAGFSHSLAALGPPSPGNSASAAGLIPDDLASGRRTRYFFIYKPGPPDKAGHIKTYTVIARPVAYGKTGANSYFTDESGVIRQTGEDRLATSNDPPLGG